MIQEQKENRLLRNVLFTFFISGAASQPLGSFVPFLREAYGLSYDMSGMLLSAQSVGNLFAILAAGVLPVYLGRRKSILITASWMAVAYLIFASGFGTPALLFAACLMTGIARGGNANFSNTMVSTLSPQKAARGYNLLHGCFSVGALISPLLLILCATLWPQIGWRVTAAVICLLAAAGLLVYAKMPLPQENSKRSIRQVDYSFLKVRQFWLGAAMLFFYISTEYAIMGWLVTYFIDIGVLSASQSQMMNSLLCLVIFLGRMTGAAVTGKISKNKLLLADGIGFFAFFLLLFFSRTPLLITIGLIGAGFFMSTIYPTAFAFGSSCIRGNDLGASIMIFTGSAGGIITPALVGFVAQRANIQSGMLVVVVFTALLMLTILLSVLILAPSKSAEG